jgi:hypothetical protein
VITPFLDARIAFLAAPHFSLSGKALTAMISTSNRRMSK